MGAFKYANGKTIDVATLFPANSGWSAPLYVTGINDGGENIGEGYRGNVQTPFALVAPPSSPGRTRRPQPQ